MPLGTLPPNRRKANVQRSIVSFVARQHMTKNVLFWTRLERRCQRTFGLDADACKAIAAALQADHGRCYPRHVPVAQLDRAGGFLNRTSDGPGRQLLCPTDP